MPQRLRCWSYHWSKSGDQAVVRLAGKEIRLDEEGVQLLADELASLGCREVVLDFLQVEFIGAATLTRLPKLQERLLATGRRLRLSGIDEASIPLPNSAGGNH